MIMLTGKCRNKPGGNNMAFDGIKFRGINMLLRVVLALGVVAGLTGCSGLNQALTKGQDKLDMGENGIVLAKVHISNQNKPGFQPTIPLVAIRQLTPVSASLYIQTKDALYKEVKDEYKEYLLSFSLKPGEYNFQDFAGNYSIPFLLNANCSVKVNTPFTVKQGVVSYLGNIEATIVERKGDEERAGSQFPLIDQAIAGFSNGTFNIKITDRYDEDLAAYKAEYPALRLANVEKQLLHQ